MRLWQWLSKAGFGSRSQVLAQFASWHVTVNGHSASPLTQLTPTDRVLVNGQTVAPPTADVQVWAWHKPVGVDCNVREGQSDSVWQRLQQLPAGTHPVGRLDKDSHGLMLLSSSGQLTHQLMHPQHEFGKTYQVHVSGLVSDEVLQRLQCGPAYQVGPHTIQPQPCQVRLLQQFTDGALLEMQLHEGKNRQIRYMCRAVGLKVVDLQRMAIGSVLLGDLAVDALRPLSPQELLLLPTDAAT